MTFKNITYYFSVVIIALFIHTGCTQTTDNNITDEDTTTTTAAAEEDKIVSDALNKAMLVIYSVPSPVETTQLFERAGAIFNEDILNPAINADNYNTSKSMALNLGIYTADLSYASLFNQAQTILEYMTASKKLADRLGISDAINDSTVSEFNNNINNKNVLMDIIASTFMNSNESFKEGNRPEIGTMLMVGGWIEGLYISVQLTNKSLTENPDLINIIIDQKLSLNDLISLLDIYKKNKDIASLMADIISLKTVYDKVVFETINVESTTDKNNNVTTIKSNTKTSITPEVFKELCNKVEKIRNNYIQ